MIKNKFEYNGISYDIKETIDKLTIYEKTLIEIKEELEYNQKYLDYNKLEDKRYKIISNKLLKLIRKTEVKDE